MTNGLSFDVEDYFHVHGFQRVVRRSDWSQYESRVEASTHRILRLLRAHDSRATFFVLGWVAERHPTLVRDIAEDGHEIASHGHHHESVYELTPEQFRSDLERSIEAISSACPSAELNGYRAPSLSINESTPWAFAELVRAGFRYDSSVSPATLHDRYGVKGAPRFAYNTLEGVLEIPPASVKLFGHVVPVVCGGHFRLAPLNVSRWAIQSINQEGHAAVIYLHPWEFDPEQPVIEGTSWSSRMRHFVNIRRTESRLQRLLAEFRFDRLDEVFGRQLKEVCEEPSASRCDDSSVVPLEARAAR